MENFKDNRRNFIKKITAIGVISQIPFWYSCDTNNKVSFVILTHKQQELLQSVMSILFPHSDSIGIERINSLYYLDFVLSDTNFDPDEQEYLLDGIKKTEAFSMKIANQSFVELSLSKQQKILEHIVQKDWGSFWLSRLLTIIFESLLLDPVYNVNIKESGWNWLHHKSGLPRPTAANTYQNLLKRKEKTQVITNISQL